MRRRLLVLLGIAAVLGGLAFALTRPPSRARFDALVAAEKAAGRPVTMEEAVGTVPPDDANGASDIDAALQWMTDKHGSEGSWTVAGPWGTTVDWEDEEPPERIDELRRFLAESQPFFDLVAKSVAKPRIVAPVVRDAKGMIDFGDVALCQRVQRVLQARALADSDTAGRVETTRLLAELSTRREPHSLIGIMVNTALMNGALNALRRDVERGSVDAAAARAALSPALGHRWIPKIGVCVKFERLWLMELGERIADGVDVNVLIGWPSPQRSGLDRLKERVEALFTGEHPATPDDFADALEAMRTLEDTPTDSYVTMETELRAKIAAHADERFVAMILMPYPKMSSVFGRTDAKQRLALIALAAAEHRATRGKLPASLAELAWAFPDGIPLDPFTDAPFEFTLGEKALRIASAGRIASDSAKSEAELVEDGLVWSLKR